MLGLPKWAVYTAGGAIAIAIGIIIYKAVKK
jgi:hypothetical protein